VASNGNGSLMRIAPLVFYITNKPIKERFEIARKVSSITHGHIRSVISCFYYLEFARQIMQGFDKYQTYQNLKSEISEFLKSVEVPEKEISQFDRLLKENIYELNEEDILSTGYVLRTLEASIWCVLTSFDYKTAVLKAVNLGDDTDTTAAVTGGLAGLLFGFESIPKSWIELLARKEDIFDLSERMSRNLHVKLSEN
jgi:ADP-ribosylglycohydrolase